MLAVKLKTEKFLDSYTLCREIVWIAALFKCLCKVRRKEQGLSISLVFIAEMSEIYNKYSYNHFTYREPAPIKVLPT